MTNLENELATVLRELSPEDQLEIIMQIMQKNVRAAATLAVRAHLPLLQQISLLKLVLEMGKSNLTKCMISALFVHRMKAEIFLDILKEKRSAFPVAVNFAAYYFLTYSKLNLGTQINLTTRTELQKLLDETKSTLVIINDREPK